MRWTPGGRSPNLEDRRGESAGLTGDLDACDTFGRTD